MEFTYIGDGIDAVVIDNFYTQSQLNEIMTELKWLTKPSIMLHEDRLYSAPDNDSGGFKTSKRGVFLESIFRNRNHSALITHAKNNFLIDTVQKQLLSYNTMFKILYACDTTNHLISYYEDSDYYKPHTDTTVFTVLNYFFTEPKQFTGGDVKLFSCNSSKEATVETKHNRVILIAGSTPHEVTPIKSELNNSLSGNGRYCNAVFLNLMGLPTEEMKAKNDSN